MNENQKEIDSKSWSLIEKTLEEITNEQRKSRRWGIFFKSVGLLYLFSFIAVFVVQGNSLGAPDKEPHVALVKIHGMIAESEPANANAVATSLRKAFDNEHSKAVVLAINSPGGSPVQSSYIYNEINRLKAKSPDKKVYAVISDMGASGAYYIASAADFIYANQSSLVGSIGVTAAGFGFVDLIEKMGIERRNYTSGEHKSFLDPFSPSNPEEVEFWNTVLKQTHQQFISDVIKGRGDRLAADDTLYSGLIWNGTQAKELGLIDDFGSAGEVARDIIGVEEFVDYTVKKDPLNLVIEKLGLSIGHGFFQQFLAEGASNAALQLQ